jgi:DNA ligase (NAD+)
MTDGATRDQDQNQLEAEAAALRAEIERHNRLYYQKDTPEISDSEYDKLFRRLVELEDSHPWLKTEDSPTQKVGSDPLSAFEQRDHRLPMLSLENLFSLEELQAFDQRIRRALKTPGDEPLEYECEIKLDGASISLLYEQGLLAAAVTRGDGFSGELVTENAKTIRGIPLKVSHQRGLLEVRGEVIMLKSVFDALNKERAERGEQVFVNPRNAGSGGLRQLDSRQTAARKLNFVAYGVGAVEPPLEEETQNGVMDRLDELGFPVPGLRRVCKGVEAIQAFIEEVGAERAKLPYGIDGVVIKLNNLAAQQEVGFTARGPRWAAAYKFEAEQAFSQLKAITNQVGRTGAVTPVAEIEPVSVGGATVTRATLHNYDEVQRKDVRVGDTVIVQRAGDVIPEIVGPVLSARPDGLQRPVEPTTCPECSTPLERTREGAVLRCPNPHCPAQIAAKLRHFASRKAMDIDGLGEKLIDRFLELGFLTDLASIYTLHDHRTELDQLEGLGEKSVSKLIQSIEASKSPPLSRFLFALGIRHVGERTARQYADAFKTLEAFRHANYATLEAIPDTGPITASEVELWLEDPENQQLIDRLLAAGVVPQAVATSNRPKRLDGLTVVFTGKLEEMTREEAEALAADLGATPSSSVSRTTNLVVAGPGAGSKLKKAEELGIPVWDESEFLEWLRSEKPFPS